MPSSTHCGSRHVEWFSKIGSHDVIRNSFNGRCNRQPSQTWCGLGLYLDISDTRRPGWEAPLSPPTSLVPCAHCRGGLAHSGWVGGGSWSFYGEYGEPGVCVMVVVCYVCNLGLGNALILYRYHDMILDIVLDLEYRNNCMKDYITVKGSDFLDLPDSSSSICLRPLS